MNIMFLLLCADRLTENFTVLPPWWKIHWVSRNFSSAAPGNGNVLRFCIKFSLHPSVFDSSYCSFRRSFEGFGLISYSMVSVGSFQYFLMFCLRFEFLFFLGIQKEVMIAFLFRISEMYKMLKVKQNAHSGLLDFRARSLLVRQEMVSNFPCPCIFSQFRNNLHLCIFH